MQGLNHPAEQCCSVADDGCPPVSPGIFASLSGILDTVLYVKLGIEQTLDAATRWACTVRCVLYAPRIYQARQDIDAICAVGLVASDWLWRGHYVLMTRHR